MKHKDPIALILIGYRGTGKTTVAKLIAESCGWDWVDADVELERRVGKSIKSIFADEGEPTFRQHEAEVLADLLKRERCVIATGGGVILREENRKRIQSAGLTVWLTATPKTIWQRISDDATTAERRPNLTDQGGFQEIVTVLAEREPLYRQSSSFSVPTDDRQPLEIAAEVMRRSKKSRDAE